MIKLFAFDLDGTLYKGNQVIDGAIELIDYLRQDYKIAFHTNASGKSIEQIHYKLCSMGIYCDTKEIYTSSQITALYLKENNIDDVYVIGSEEFKNEIHNVGIIVNDTFSENLVVGLDTNFKYEKITIALNILLNGGKFIACNEDDRFPVEKGYMPGSGAMVGAIEKASGIKPIIIGKPNTYILQKISKDYDILNNEICVVGDTSSDRDMALNFGSQIIMISDNSEFPNFKNVKSILNFMKGNCEI